MTLKLYFVKIAVFLVFFNYEYILLKNKGITLPQISYQ